MNIQQIPLNKLIPSPANVRRYGAAAGIDEMAASIKALGLLQNLQVRPNDNGKFEVAAGMRRLKALKKLAKEKFIPKDEPIECNVLRDDEDPSEISLAENVIRLPMHPADQFEAFKGLADSGKGNEEIAARFGCSPVIVRQRLKLAGVSPALLDAYRAEEMTLDQLMAFTVSDDHDAQEKVWNGLAAWNRDPSIIRRQLTSAHVECHDRRVRFVGIEAYKTAGGHILRDLFHEEHEGYLTDPALLDRLVTGKLESEAEAIRAEGWQWVEIMPEIGYDRLHQMARVYPERVQSGDEQQAEIDGLTARYEGLIEEHGEDPPEDIAAELEALSDRIDGLSEATERWLPEDVARAGVVIGIGHAGQLSVQRGLVRTDEAAGTKDKPTTGKERRKTNGTPALSDALAEDLTAHRTAALRTVLAGNADVALAAVVHALALPLFFPHQDESCLGIGLDSAELRGSAEGIEEGPAAAKLAAQHEFWKRHLPGTAEGLWGWLLSQDTATRLDLLAYCAGCSVNAVRKRHERVDTDRLNHADRLAGALTLDMAAWWQPTAQSYLRHVTKARILEAVKEGVTPEAAENLAKLKKDALAAEAEQRLADTGWLPAILRTPAAAATEAVPEVIAAE